VPRRYELKRRAERRDETRRRIVDATIHLHQTVGPVGASISAIAREAGVSRLTVYRHFPDEVSLLQACTSTYNAANPPPDPAALLAIADPLRRLEAALHGLYAYYADNEAMLLSGADAMPTHPALGVALAPFFEGQRRIFDLLASGWEVDGGPGTALHGAIGHAVALLTWRSLRHEQGLSPDQAVGVMVGMVKAAKDLSWFD
jgi:AcrR family transcriptional regulator